MSPSAPLTWGGVGLTAVSIVTLYLHQLHRHHHLAVTPRLTTCRLANTTNYHHQSRRRKRVHLVLLGPLGLFFGLLLLPQWQHVPNHVGVHQALHLPRLRGLDPDNRQLHERSGLPFSPRQGHHRRLLVFGLGFIQSEARINYYHHACTRLGLEEFSSSELSLRCWCGPLTCYTARSISTRSPRPAVFPPHESSAFG